MRLTNVLFVKRRYSSEFTITDCVLCWAQDEPVWMASHGDRPPLRRVRLNAQGAPLLLLLLLLLRESYLRFVTSEKFPQ